MNLENLAQKVVPHRIVQEGRLSERLELLRAAASSIAEELEARGMSTRRACKWHVLSARNVLVRIEGWIVFEGVASASRARLIDELRPWSKKAV